MQTLTDALARAVTRVTTGVVIGQLEREADGSWTVTGTRGGEPFVRHARSVVLATPAYDAARLVRLLAPARDARSRRHPYAPIASVATVYPRSDIAHSLAGFGFLVPRRSRRKILGCLFSSSMFDGRAPAETVLLTSFVGGARHPGASSRIGRRDRGDRAR